MGKLYFPIANRRLNEDTYEQYFRLLAKFDVERVFICATENKFFFARGEERKALYAGLKRNIEVLAARGYQVGVWIYGLGMSQTLTDEQRELAKDYINLKSVSGVSREGHHEFCVTSEAFARDYAQQVRDVAATGCDMLMLDDDLCHSVRPGIGCFCEKHLALMEKELGEPFPRENLPRALFTGGKNKYRSAWLRVMGDTMREFARTLRAAADEVNPQMRMGFCAGYTSWDIEGVDALELTKILAGGTKPFLRFTGAPYWAAPSIDRFAGQPLGEIVEETRAQEAYCRGSGVEVFFEGDTYPRPRYMVPSSTLECFALPCHASGGMGELAYLFEYNSLPEYELGYIKHRLYNKPMYEFLEKHFADKSPNGVRIYQEMRKVENVELPVTDEVFEKGVMRGHFNRGAELLALHGIPTVYGEACECGIAFGEEARYVSELPKKLILDAKGARILLERGYDVGLLKMEKTGVPSIEHHGGERAWLSRSESEGYWHVELAEGARVVSEFEVGGVRLPACWQYVANGTEFLVYAFDADLLPHRSAVWNSYLRQAELLEFCGKLSHIKKAPGVYQLCKKGEGATALLFVNIHDDPIFDGEIVLDGAYSEMEICGAEGELAGDRVKLKTVVPPHGAVALVLK